MSRRTPTLLLLLLSTLATRPASSETAWFTHSPIDLGQVERIVPLGNLNPPGHTLPTDHAYLYLRDHSRRRPVFAIAAGTVERIHARSDADAKVTVRVSSRVRFYLDHVIPGPDLTDGAALPAGARLGTTSGLSHALDLGVIDEETTLPGLLRPERYPWDTVHAVSPFPHFCEPWRSRMYALIRRVGPDKDGKIDFDRPGRLVGNWFLAGLAPEESARHEAWEKHLAFVYDVEDPTAVRISIGGTLDLIGVFAVPAQAPDPAAVSRGIVNYEMRRLDGSVAGRLWVEMVGTERIRVQAFVGAEPGEIAFDARARTYVR